MPLHHEISQPLPWEDRGMASRRRSSNGSARRNSLLTASLFDFPLTPGAQRDLAQASCFPYESSDPFAPLSLNDPLTSMGLHMLASPRRSYSRPTVTDRLLGDRSEGSIPTVVSAGSHHSPISPMPFSNSMLNSYESNCVGSSISNHNGMYINNCQQMEQQYSAMPMQASSSINLQRNNSLITPLSTSSCNNFTISFPGSSSSNTTLYPKERMGSITNGMNCNTVVTPSMNTSGTPTKPFTFNKTGRLPPVNKKPSMNEYDDDNDDDDEDEDPNGHRFKPFHEEKWSVRYKELLDFHKQTGHAAVPHTYPPNPQLARWVKRQRRQYKLRQDNRQSTMTTDRLELLNSVGFVWDSHDVNWREKLDSLMTFRQEHGHCNVPSNYRNKKLATWIKCQRRQYKLYWDGKPSAMSPERILELEKVGFEWEIRSTVPRKSETPKTPKTSHKIASIVSNDEDRLSNNFSASLMSPTSAPVLKNEDFQLLYQNLKEL